MRYFIVFIFLLSIALSTRLKLPQEHAYKRYHDNAEVEAVKDSNGNALVLMRKGSTTLKPRFEAKVQLIGPSGPGHADINIDYLEPVPEEIIASCIHLLMFKIECTDFDRDINPERAMYTTERDYLKTLIHQIYRNSKEGFKELWHRIARTNKSIDVFLYLLGDEEISFVLQMKSWVLI